MDIDTLLSIVTASMAFTAGALIARGTNLPIWILCLVYFIVTSLFYIVVFYVFGVTL